MPSRSASDRAGGNKHEGFNMTSQDMTSQAVLFPGQGAQFVGMSADLIDRCGAVAGMFEAASERMGADLLELCKNGPEATLNSTAVSQPAIFVVSLAVIRAIEEAGGADRLQAMGTAGLSLGEYSALVFAGAMTFETGLDLVVRRGKYMQEACDREPSGMASILGLDLPTVRQVVEDAASEGVVAVANVNASNQIVISGTHVALEKALDLAEERGARRVIPLRVAGAYHSPLMASASEQLRPHLEAAEIVSPRIPFYANVSAERVEDPAVIREGLMRQIESSVLWAPTLEALVGTGMKSVLEPGPGRVVAGLVKQVDRRMPVSSVLAGETIDEFVG
jgi:[acyl-carrier-protein] S-malonyltransferase